MRASGVVILLLLTSAELGWAKTATSLTKTSFTGEVQAIDLKTNRLKVADQDGHTLQMTANPSTEILKNDKRVPLAELKPHDPVIVRYWVDSNNP